ncbi:acyltransferase family protein [Herbaspirillum sp. YR522]|uniref:acyltransferase family protein n=1 Tax=Herbaspirillum sp. YR522 TaxID=1144342 RepID=UPI00026F7F48|nr:acyltransferase family protein [Herbaspirillum sp. YR522]EJN08096.1 putative acyltransferase [Herbaspirillum sp. YR522]
MKTSHQAYRPDIDGLRAVAILPVVLFHIGFPGFFGGFVGVDVFFVISGYLITGIIVRELRQGTFSIADFYRRRVLRIFPALFVMLLVVSVLAALVMLPAELLRYGKSVAATTLFSSNILFYSESGYFAPDSHTKALLHTWSLAVEEQFYLFWPLILMALSTSRQTAIRWGAVIITVVSLGWSVWLLKHDATATFYLIPTRAWELMAGALVAIFPGLPANRRWLREVLAALGLLMILVAIKFYNDSVPFPGAAALLPCVGAAAIILAGSGGNSLVGRLLSWQPAVFIGKISFSLYLWHWPVIVFTQIGLLREQTWTVKVIELLASFVLGTLSWRYVERPFRHVSAAVPNRQVLGRAGVAIALGLVVGLLYVVPQGWPQRFNEQQLAAARYETYDGDHEYRGGTCFVVGDNQKFDAAQCLQTRSGSPNLLFIGDSHAAHLWPGLQAEAGAAGINVLQATHTGCRPAIADLAQPKGACQKFVSQIVTEWLPAHPVDVVVLAGRWTRADLPGLPKVIAAARQHAKRVVVVGPIQQYVSALPRFLVRASSNQQQAAAQGLASGPFALDPQLREVAVGAGAQYFSLIGALCAQRSCKVTVDNGVPLQFDYGHLTVEGSRYVVGLMMPVLDGRKPVDTVASVPAANGPRP